MKEIKSATRNLLETLDKEGIKTVKDLATKLESKHEITLNSTSTEPNAKTKIKTRKSLYKTTHYLIEHNTNSVIGDPTIRSDQPNIEIRLNPQINCTVLILQTSRRLPGYDPLVYHKTLYYQMKQWGAQILTN